MIGNITYNSELKFLSFSELVIFKVLTDLLVKSPKYRVRYNF